MSTVRATLIQEYNERWIDDFNAIRSVISESLYELEVEIEHVGSTAIPNLAAKEIIDIDIIYEDGVQFLEIKKCLESIGYYYNGDQGLAQREVFKRNKNRKVNHEVLDKIAHHLYVCPVESEQLRRHLLFRNYLTVHEEARHQYQDLKYKIAKIANQDSKVYASLKDSMAREFIDGIVAQAKKEGIKQPKVNSK